MHTQLDARRLLCPMPLIRLQQKVKQLQSGDTVDVLSTDPGTLQDIPSWCRMYGHRIIATEQQPDLITIVVQVE